jgi:hypothetical protein
MGLNIFDIWQLTFDEFGVKTMFIWHNEEMLRSFIVWLKLQDKLTVYNMLVLCSKAGMIEILKITKRAEEYFDKYICSEVDI